MDRRNFYTRALAGGAGLFSVLLGKKAGAQVIGPQTGTLETWHPRRAPARDTLGLADRTKLVREIWDSYGLASPNYNDTIDMFCDAMMADWQRDRFAYVWRYASTSGNQVYVLPGRFVMKHPGFMPDFPAGYYWLDPVRRVAGVILTQILPFADPTVVRLYGQFERGVYALAEAR